MPGAVAHRVREPRQEPYSNVHAAMFAAGRHNPASQTCSSTHLQQQLHGCRPQQQSSNHFQLNVSVLRDFPRKYGVYKEFAKN